MKDINNKGFTLIELLAVVVILLAITVVAISSISASMERNKSKQDAKKIEIIESSAKSYYNEHKNSLKNASTIQLSDLSLSSEEVTDANGDRICGYVSISSDKKTFTFNRVACS